MTQSEIKELTTEEVVERIEEESASLSKLKLNHQVSELENPMQIKVARKSVARLKTELRKRQLEETQK